MANRVIVRLEGIEEHLALMARLPDAMDIVIEPAANAGAQLLRDEMAQNAPGPHIVKEVSKKERGRITIVIGPDKAHWYYQFFETGAAAHEISPRRRREVWYSRNAARAGGGTGKKALAFGEEVFSNVKHPGVGMRAFMRPAVDSKHEEAAKKIAARFREQIEKMARG